MLWRKRRAPEDPAGEAPAPGEAPASAPAPPAEAEDLADRALDAVAGVLRSYGDQAFDIDGTPAGEIREACERWARHLLVGTPAEATHTRVETAAGEAGDEGEPPDPAPEAEAPGGAGPFPRDFRGLLAFFSGQRGRENRYVIASLGDLRQAIWAMIGGLRGVVTDDRRDDALASIHLQRLGAAVESSSTERIRREARECVRIVGEIIEKRRLSQQERIEELGTRLREMRGELERAWEETERDALTGLASRPDFDAQLERVVDVGFLFPEPSFLFRLEVDHLKWVTDRFGPEGGDEVLRRIGRCLDASFLRRNDFVARYAPEEFAALVRVDNRDLAERLAERVLFAVRDLEIELEGEPVRVSTSIGVAQLRSAEEAGSWLGRAEAALETARQAGRDRAEFAQDG